MCRNFVSYFLFLPTSAGRVVKDRSYADLTSYSVCADRQQVRHQNKAKRKLTGVQGSSRTQTCQITQGQLFFWIKSLKYQECACSCYVGKIFSIHLLHLTFALFQAKSPIPKTKNNPKYLLATPYI